MELIQNYTYFFKFCLILKKTEKMRKYAKNHLRKLFKYMHNMRRKMKNDEAKKCHKNKEISR